MTTNRTESWLWHAICINFWGKINFHQLGNPRGSWNWPSNTWQAISGGIFIIFINFECFRGKKGSDYSNYTNRHRLAFTMNYGKFGSNRFPSKCLNIVLDFHRINRNLFFSHMENFKVKVESSVFVVFLFFPQFAVTINLDEIIGKNFIFKNWY